MRHTNVLRAPPEYPESAMPGHVRKIERPPALPDFGLITVSRTSEKRVVRGAGSSPDGALDLGQQRNSVVSA